MTDLMDLMMLACLCLLMLAIAITRMNKMKRSRIRYFGRMGSVIMEGQVPEARPRQYPHGQEGVLVAWDDSEDPCWVPLWQLGGFECWVDDPDLRERAKACHDDYQTKLDGMYE